MQSVTKQHYSTIVWGFRKSLPTPLEQFFTYILIIDCALLFIVAGKIPFQTTAAYAAAAGENTPLAQQAFFGNPAKDVVAALKEQGLTATPISTIQRKQLSPEGTILSINSDTIQVFEYTDDSLAQKELEAFAARYASTTSYSSWKKQVSLYSNGKTLVYYLGTKKTIIEPLEHIFGSSIAQK